MISMIDETYVSTHQEELAKKYVDTLLYRVSRFSFKSNSNLIDEYVYKKSMIVDISFACELLIKILLLRQGLDLDTFNTHDLSSIFNMLDSNTQSSIKSNMALLGETDFDTKLNLDINKFTYERSRYVYEENTGNTDYVFISNLCRALYKEVNNKELEHQLIDSNMSDTDYDSINKVNLKIELIKKYSSYQFGKVEWSRPGDNFTEEEKYISRNITSCDMALFCELLLKRYSDQGAKTHDYKNLHKKLDEAIRYMFEKGIYSDFETNRYDKYALFYSEESFLYPDNFTADYSAERNGILKTLSDIFLLSRYGCFEYFDKYDEMLKFYRISKGIEVFVDGNEDTINRLMEFRNIVNYGSWYGFTVSEILTLDMEYLKQLDEIFKTKYPALSVLAFRNLINVKKENQSKVLSVLADNIERYRNILGDINDDTIDYFINNKMEVDKIVDSELVGIKFGKITNIGISYVYKLVSDDIVSSSKDLITNIVNNGKIYDFNRIIFALHAILNSRQLSPQMKQNIIRNITTVLEYSVDRMGHAVAMLNLAFSYRINVGIGIVTNPHFISRKREEIEQLLDYYVKYSWQLPDERFFNYLSNGDTNVIKKMEDIGILSGIRLDLDYLIDPKVSQKYIDYVIKYGWTNSVGLQWFATDMDIDDVYRLVNTHCARMIDPNKESKEKILNQLDRIELFNKLFANFPEMQTYINIMYVPDYLLANDGARLKKLIEGSYFFTNYRSINSKYSIVKYYERLFFNHSKGILGEDFERLFKIDDFELFREHPEVLDRVNPKDYVFYTASGMNTIYCLIKSGNFVVNNMPYKVNDTTALVEMFLNSARCDVNTNSRIKALFTNKSIINNMSNIVMRYGKKEILEERIKDFKSNDILMEYDKSGKSGGTLYDFITFTWSSGDDIHMEYDVIKEYFDYLNNLYNSNRKGLKNILLNHIGILLSNSVFSDEYFPKIFIEAKKYIDANPDKIQSVLEDVNLYMENPYTSTFESFTNKDFATSVIGPKEEIPLYVPINEEFAIVDPELNYVLYNDAGVSIPYRPLYIFDVMKDFVYSTSAKIKSYILTALYDSKIKEVYLSIKKYWNRISKSKERKFKRLEKEISESLNKEIKNGRVRSSISN